MFPLDVAGDTGPHRPPDVEGEGVQVVRRALYPHQQAPVKIPNLENAIFNQDLEPLRVELFQAHDVRGEARDVVHPSERLVFTVLALEQHNPAPLDVEDGAIPELHGALDARVQLREG